MLNYIKITPKSPDIETIKNLYEEAFPENERGDFNELLEDPSNCSEILAFYDEEKFCGFTSSLVYNHLYHIIYFAVMPQLQGKGYGSQILQLLSEIKDSYSLIVDIEAQCDKATNNPLRAKRKSFYLKNNFYQTSVAYEWQGDPYEILTNKDDISEDEFWHFWDMVTLANSNFLNF